MLTGCAAVRILLLPRFPGVFELCSCATNALGRLCCRKPAPVGGGGGHEVVLEAAAVAMVWLNLRCGYSGRLMHAVSLARAVILRLVEAAGES